MLIDYSCNYDSLTISWSLSVTMSNCFDRNVHLKLKILCKKINSIIAVTRFGNYKLSFLKFFLISRLWAGLGNNNSNFVPQDKQKTMISANIQICLKVTPHSQLISDVTKNHCFFNWKTKMTQVEAASTTIIMTQRHIANFRVASRAKMKNRLDWRQPQIISIELSTRYNKTH